MKSKQHNINQELLAIAKGSFLLIYFDDFLHYPILFYELYFSENSISEVMILIKKMDHIGIFVTDIKKAIAFYSDVFGFELLYQGDNGEKTMAFLTHPGNEDMQLELVQDLVSSTQYAEIGKVNHLAFTVDNMDEAIARLKEKGIDMLNEPGINKLTNSKTVFFKGHDQELLQLIEPLKNK